MSSLRGWSVGLWMAGLLLVLDFSLAPLIGLETDLWWHLAAGRRLFEHGLELRDPFSFSFAEQAWIRIDWLYQAVVFALYRMGGLSALLWTRTLLFVASGCVLGNVLRTQGVSWPRIWLVVMGTALIWSQAAGLRPATLSIFFTCLWVFVLERARHGQTRRLLWLGPLMVLWFNIHVAALAGVLLLGLYALGQWVDWLVAGRKSRPSGLWLAMLPATLLATLVTPQPWQLFYYPLHFLLVKSPWSQMILEVQPAGWDMAGTAECRLLLFVAAWGALLQLQRRQSTGLWLCLVCGYLMNATYRHQFQLCSVLAPLAGHAVQHARLPAVQILRRLGALAILLLAIRSGFSLVVCKLPPAGLMRRESYPQAQAAWLAQLPGGQVFTDMNTAGYYMWVWGGSPRVFIDSRGDQVYSRPEFVAEYFKILEGQPEALALLDRYQVSVVALQALVSGPYASQSGLDGRLSQSPEWGPPLYQDRIGRVYVRASGARPPASARPPAYLEAFQQGLALSAMGQKEAALDRLYESLQDYPQFPYAHRALAQIWLERGQLSMASRELARAELYHPNTGFVDSDWSAWAARGGWAALARWPWLRAYCLPFLAL
jgi:tetratricopeptide (TPR) repeat protein